MNELYLIAGIAGERIALSSAHVESVVEIDAITAVPMVAPHIAGLAALRSRVLTIVDTLAALDLGQAERDEILQAVIVTVDGHLYGLLVDQVEDVVSLSDPPAPIRAVLSPGWARVTIGSVEIDGDALLLIDPAALVAGPAGLAAAA